MDRPVPPGGAELGVARPEFRPAPRWPSRTRSTRTSGRSSSGTATRCSSCSAPPGTSTRRRRSSSASCTCSSAPDFVLTVRHSEAPDLSRGAPTAGERPGAARPRAGGGPLRDPRRGRRRLRPVVAGLRTTSTRSRSRSSAATPRCPGGSTSCPARSSEFQRADPPAGRDARRAGAPGSTSTASTRSCSATCATSPTTSRGHRAGRRFRQRCATSSPSTRPWSRSSRTRRCAASREASIAQNEEVKKISAWAAILFAPTLIGTVYGMNFEHMPELSWDIGYAVALSLMLLTSVTLYTVFKRRDWL